MGIFTFRRPYYKTSVVQTSVLPLIALVYVIFVYTEALKFWEWNITELFTALIVIIFVGLLFWSSVFRQLYFIEINENKLVLKNGLFGHVKILYFLEHKTECLVAYNKSAITYYIKFKEKDNKKWGKYYGIDLVDPKDLKEIISILESKGVTVITKDLKDV